MSPGSGRDHQHDIVVDDDIELALAQAEPDRDLDGLGVMAAAEHADTAIVLDRRLDLHPHPGVLGKGAHDLVMRDLDEIGLGQDADEFLDEAAVSRFEIRRRTTGLRIELRVEVKIHLAQPIQFLEILVVKDGSEPAGQLPETRLPGFVEAALGDEPADQVRLPQPDDTVALLRRGHLGHRSNRPVVHEILASTTITARACPEIPIPDRVTTDVTMAKT